MEGGKNGSVFDQLGTNRGLAVDISIFRKNLPADGLLSRMTSYAGEIARRRAEISGSIKKKGRRRRRRRRALEAAGGEKKVLRVGTRRESCDLRSRRKPRVLHIRRMMSFVSSLRPPVALNSSYLEFQEDRPTYGDDINTRERYGREGGARHISRDTIVAH